MFYIMITIFIVLFFVINKKACIIVKKDEEKIVERFGKYSGVLESGLNFINPITDKIVETVNIATQSISMSSTSILTKDYRKVKVSFTIDFKVNDSVKVYYKVKDLYDGLTKIAVKSINEILKEINLEDVLVSNDYIKDKFKDIIEEVLQDWGCKLVNLEFADIQAV